MKQIQYFVEQKKDQTKYSYVLAIVYCTKQDEKKVRGGVWCAVKAECRALAASPGLCRGQEEQLRTAHTSAGEGTAVCWALGTSNSEPEKKKWQYELRIGETAASILNASFWKGGTPSHLWKLK